MAHAGGGQGGDDRLEGAGGADVLTGGEGDDELSVSDVLFAQVSGGSGSDELELDGSGLTLDLTAVADTNVTGIERIDLTGSGDNTLILDHLEVAGYVRGWASPLCPGCRNRTGIRYGCNQLYRRGCSAFRNG